MKFSKLFLSLGLVFATNSAATFAEPDIETRLEKIERKLQTIDRGVSQILDKLDSANDSRPSKRLLIKAGVDIACVDNFVKNQRAGGYRVEPANIKEFATLCTTEAYSCTPREP